MLAVPHLLEGSAREGLLLRFARLLNSLKGAFGTGEDLGTTPEVMHLLATVTPYAVGGSRVLGKDWAKSSQKHTSWVSRRFRRPAVGSSGCWLVRARPRNYRRTGLLPYHRVNS